MPLNEIPPSSAPSPLKTKLPWAGIAAGTASTLLNSGSSNPLPATISFATAASRNASKTGGMHHHHPNQGTTTLLTKRLSSDRIAAERSAESSSPVSDHSAHQISPDPQTDAEAILKPNVDGKQYTPDQLLDIWDKMKTENRFDQPTKANQKSDLHFSSHYNMPASIDPQLKASIRAAEEAEAAAAEAAAATVEIVPNLSNLSNLSNASSFTDQANASSWLGGGLRFSNPSGDSVNSPASGLLNSRIAPFIGAGATGSDLFSRTVTSSPPPGIPSPHPPQLLSPDQIQWIYKDPAGIERGPFSGRMMHDWYVGQWLQETLLIRREEETEFMLLKDLKAKIGNLTTPFLTPLPPVGASSSSSVNDFQSRQDELSRQHHLQQQFASLHLQQSPGWANVANPLAPLSPWQSMTGLPQAMAGGLGESSVQADPVAVSAASISLSGTSTPIGSRPAEWLESQKEVKTENDSGQSAHQQPNVISRPAKKSEPVKVDAEKKEETCAAEPKKTVEKSVETKVDQGKEPEKSEQAVSVAQPTAPAESTQATSQASCHPRLKLQTFAPAESPNRSVSSVSSCSLPASPAHTPSLAPWARKPELETKTSTLSLREIQELEAAERKKQKQASPSPVAAKAVFAKSQTPSLPSGATWATSAVTNAVPAKTLAEIQKEEEAASKKRAAAQATQVVKTGGVALVGGAERYADIAGASGLRVGSSPPSLSSTVNSGSEISDVANGWTTVGASSRKPSGASAPVAPLRPRRLVSSTSLKAKTVASSPSSSEEFLQWCKLKLNGLNAGVNQTELLSMLLSLPGTADSKEIIADTIYSNSSTMDGRHFAEEFLTRRKAADATKSGETWSDVLQRAPVVKPAPNDGWNAAFKVVTKKKKRAGIRGVKNVSYSHS